MISWVIKVPQILDTQVLWDCTQNTPVHPARIPPHYSKQFWRFSEGEKKTRTEGGSDLHLPAWQLQMQNGPPTEKRMRMREKEGKTAATIVLSNWVKSITQGGKKILCSVSLSLRGCSQPAPAPEVAGRRDTRNLLQKNMQHWVLVALWNNIQVSRHNSSQF